MWKRLADNIIKQLAKTQVTLVRFEKAKGEGKVIRTPVEEKIVNAAVSTFDDVRDVTKLEDRDIRIVFSNKDLTWMPSTFNTYVILNGKRLVITEVDHSGYIKNEPVCFILRCQHE